MIISILRTLIDEEIFYGNVNQYFESTNSCCIEIFTNFCPISKEEENLLTNGAIVKRSALFQKGMSHI